MPKKKKTKYDEIAERYKAMQRSIDAYWKRRAEEFDKALLELFSSGFITKYTVKRKRK